MNLACPGGGRWQSDGSTRPEATRLEFSQAGFHFAPGEVAQFEGFIGLMQQPLVELVTEFGERRAGGLGIEDGGEGILSFGKLADALVVLHESGTGLWGY